MKYSRYFVKEALEHLMLFDCNILKDGGLWSLVCPVAVCILKARAGLHGLMFYLWLLESARFAF